MSEADLEWWTQLYDAPFEAVMQRARSDEEMRRIAGFLVEALDLSESSVLFDQCCGTARISSPLAAQGMRVIGVDGSTNSIEIARRRARKRGLPMSFEVADAFEWAPSTGCDAGWNWWTAFGNTPSDSRNRQMLERAFEALRPGGRFALDHFNLSFLQRSFQPTRVAQVPFESGELIVVERNRLDVAEGALRISWTFMMPDGTRDIVRGYIRLYLPRQLKQMMEEVGFEAITFYGGVDGTSLGPDSPRCIVVGRKPL